MTTVADAFDLALKHHQAGALRQAEELYQQILRAYPEHADAWHLLGVLAGQLGRPDLAVECIRQALHIKPDLAEAHFNLGKVLKQQNQLAEAADSYQEALRYKPDYADASNNLGVAYHEQGLLAEAAAGYRNAIRLQPDFAAAHNNLGKTLYDQGSLSAAVASYHEALRLLPHNAETRNNLGIALREQGKLAEAVANYQEALRQKPDYAEAYHNLGLALEAQGRLEEASACYQEALRQNPDFPAALANLVYLLQHLCYWSGLDELAEDVIEAAVAQGDLPTLPVNPGVVLFMGSPPTTAYQQFCCARNWAAWSFKSGAHLSDNRTNKSQAGAEKAARIKLGYLSTDFCTHAIASLVAELFEKHDRDRFTVVGYSLGPEDGSSMRQRLVKAFDRFVDMKDLSFLEAAQLIAADNIDILIDLNGYTGNHRMPILALHPAPVQVLYLGYPGTTGAPFMDYILVDDFIVPPDQQPFYSERLVHLPGCYEVNDTQREVSPQTPSRADCGLPDEGFVFCSFNNNYKITAKMFAVWMELLKAVPQSVLWLLEGHPSACANLRREAEERGVPAARLVFGPKLPPAEHLARYRVADLFLDSFPVNAQTTASDALWVGCPVLTIAGTTFVSRAAGSLLRAINLPELVTTTFEEYQALALRLARDPYLLAARKGRLEEGRQHARLFDVERFTRNVEQAYETMWATHLAGAKPQAFAVRESELLTERIRLV